MGNFIDLTGKKFGRLTVLSISKDRGNNGEIKWTCKCDCGKIVNVLGSGLRSGKTKSCGCLKIDKISEMAVTHGESKTRLYKIWKGMHTRCYNKNRDDYTLYGGRGIKVCSEWKNDFIKFKIWAIKSGYNENAKKGSCTIDRIDVNKDYCPENCRWVSNKIQQRNKRTNHLLTANGETKTLAEWADIMCIDSATIRQRVNLLGWSEEKAIMTPVRKRK